MSPTAFVNTAMARDRDACVSRDDAPVSTTTTELAYQQSRAAVDVLAKDEHARKLRCQNLLLRHEVEELNEKLWEEQERAEEAEADLETWQSRAQTVAADFDRVVSELYSKNADYDTIKAELLSLQTISADSSKLLTQKLTLERELANVKPELEHLRSTTTSNQGLLAEKLALARQLSTAQVELESAQQALLQARSREGNTHDRNAEHDAEVSDLQRQLSKAQRDLIRADKRAEGEDSKRIKELEKQLARESRERERAEALASSTASPPDAAEVMRAELELEKQARSRVEQELRKAQQTWNADKAILEDKLNQFRTKLRSTKEKLKESEAELDEARTRTVAEQSTKTRRKRSAAQMDPDANIGTPGDAAPAKRSKRSTSVFGEKSNFSITPFLNKQASIVSEEAENAAADEPVASIEPNASPSLIAAKRQAQPLAPASPGRANPKIKTNASKRSTAKISLLSVPEEEENASMVKPTASEEGIVSQTTTFKKPKLSLKPRKTLDSFASFREASLPPQPLQQKKKRKLGGGAKTLFDEDDDEEAGAAPALKPLGGPRAFGGLGVGFKRLGALGNKSKGSLMVAEGGFTFSPLKRNLRAGSVQPGA